jgi:hypothetical protein
MWPAIAKTTAVLQSNRQPWLSGAFLNQKAEALDAWVGVLRHKRQPQKSGSSNPIFDSPVLGQRLVGQWDHSPLCILRGMTVCGCRAFQARSAWIATCSNNSAKTSALILERSARIQQTPWP